MRAILFAAPLFLLGALRAESLAGTWDATIDLGDITIPFTFELTGDGANVSGSFFNGGERVTATGGNFSHGHLSLSFDHYATRLEADVTGGQLTGQYGGKRFGQHPVTAHRHKPAAASADTGPNIAGLWDIPVESSK